MRWRIFVRDAHIHCACVPSFAADLWLIDGFASPTGVLPQSKVEGPPTDACAAPAKRARSARGAKAPDRQRHQFFRHISENWARAECGVWGVAMPKFRPKKTKRGKHAAIARIPGRPAKPSPKLVRGSRRVAAEIGEIVRKRAEAEAAIADARKSHERLREAIDILPQGIVFLDAEGRYILWNKKYAEIYNRSSDLFAPGARLAGHHPHRRRTRRLSGSARPRGRVDRRAAGKAPSARRTPRADAGRRPRHPDRGAADRGWRRHRPAGRHHRAEAARGFVPPAVRQQSRAHDRLRAGWRAHPRRQ